MLDGPPFSTEPPPIYLRYAELVRGPPSDPAFFPIHRLAAEPGQRGEFAAIGIDFFTGLYDGPSDAQLATLAAADMPAIADQNGEALASPDSPSSGAGRNRTNPTTRSPTAWAATCRASIPSSSSTATTR